jgi:hypothetical protein
MQQAARAAAGWRGVQVAGRFNNLLILDRETDACQKLSSPQFSASPILVAVAALTLRQS